MKLETGQDNLDDAPSSPEFNERPEQYDFHEESDNADNESSDEDEHNHVGHYLNPVYNLQDLDTDDDDDTVNSQEFGGPLWRYHANQMEGLSLSEPENEPQEMEPNEVVNIVQEESSESSEMDSYSSRPDESDSVEIIEEINEITNNLRPQEPLQATNNILNLQIIGERFMNWFRANYADIINILCTDPAASIYPIPMRFFSPRSLLVPKNYSNENDGYESTQSSISSLNSSPLHSSNNIAPGNFVYTTPQSSPIHYRPTVLNPANSESTQSHPAPISTHYGPPINQRCPPPGHFYTAFYVPRIQTPAPRANPPRAFYYVPIYRPQIYRGYPGNPSAHYNASYYRGYPGRHATDYNTTDNQGHTPFYSANYDASNCDGSEGYNSSDNEEYAGSYSENCRASWKGGDEIVSSDEYDGSDNEDYGNTSENYSSDTENDIDDSMGPYLEDCNASNSHIGPSSQEYNERPNYTYTGPYLTYTDPRTYKSQNTYMNFNDQDSPSYPCSSFTNSNGQYLRYPNVQYIPRYVRPYYINYSQPTTRYAYPCYINSNGQYVRGIPGAYPMHYNGLIRGYTPVHYVLNYNYRMCYQTHIRYPGPHSGYYQAPCHYVNVCADSINSNASNNLGSDPDRGDNYPNFQDCHDTGECLGPDSEITN